MADPKSGIDEQGEWTPAFEGQRPPFEAGNELAFKPGNSAALVHGAYSSHALAPRVEELVATLRELVPGCSESDEPAVRALAFVEARIEASGAALARLDEAYSEGRELGHFVGQLGEASERLRADHARWLNTARRYYSDLGLTPRSRVQLGLEIAATRSALTAAKRREQLIAKTRESAGDVVDGDAVEEQS